MASLDPSTFRGEEDVPLSFDVLAALAFAHSAEPETALSQVDPTFDYKMTIDVMDVLDQLQYDQDSSEDDESATVDTSAAATPTPTPTSPITITEADPLPVSKAASPKPRLKSSTVSVPISEDEIQVVSPKASGLSSSPPKKTTLDRSRSTGDAFAETKTPESTTATGFFARAFGMGASKARSATSTTDVTRSASADTSSSKAPKVGRSKSVSPPETKSKPSIDTLLEEEEPAGISRASSFVSRASLDSSGDGDEPESVVASSMYEVESSTLPLGVAPYAKDVAETVNSSEWEMTKYVLHRLGTSRQSIGDLDGRKLTHQQLLVKQKTGIKSHLLVSKGLDFSKVLYERRSTEVAFAEAQAKQKKLEPISGYVTKHAGGKHLGMWKKRWLICKRGYLLWAKKPTEIDNPAKVEERARFLNSISMLRVHKAIKVNSKNGRKFNIIATKRVYRMRALSKKQRDDWVEGINDHLQTMQFTMKLIHGLSHFAPSLASKMAEQDAADEADGLIGDGFKAKKPVVSSAAADM